MGSVQSHTPKTTPPPPPPAPAPAPAPSPPPSLDEKIGHLEKRKKYLEVNIRNYTDKAKECIAQKDEIGAKRYLVSAKRCRDELPKVYGMLVRLEEMKHAQETTRINRDVLLSIEHGTKNLGETTMNIDRAETIIDNLEEAMQNAHEITDVFTRTTPNDPSVDAELAEMMKEPTVHIPELPKLPTRPVVGMEAEIQQTERLPMSA